MDEGSYESLLKFLSESFPQFKAPEVNYEENSEEKGNVGYIARFKLLGQTFSSGSHKSKQEALELVSLVALEAVKEFQTLILKQTDESLECEALFSLFRPLKAEAKKVASTVTQEALRSVSEIKNRLIEVENEKINSAVKSKSEKIVKKMQGAVQSSKPEPVKIPKIEVQSSKPEPVKIPKIDPATDSQAPVTDSAPSNSNKVALSLSPLKIDEPSRGNQKTNIGAPIPTFYEFVEKQSSSEAIVFEDFVKGQNYGCRLRWGKRFWVAPAEYRQKKDAHNYAAVMACVELFGEGFIFEGVDPRIYNKWTRETVRAASDKYSFATSDELLENEASNSVQVDVTNLKTIEPLPDGRKYLSVINEICQKMRYTPPNYQASSVNTLTNYYVCTVKNFSDLPPIESAPFTKKAEAKEDAAARIYYILKERGIVDEANRIISRQKAMELSASRIEEYKSIINRPEFERPVYERAEFDRPNHSRPEFERPIHARSEFDRPNHSRPEFERSRNNSSEFYASRSNQDNHSTNIPFMPNHTTSNIPYDPNASRNSHYNSNFAGSPPPQNQAPFPPSAPNMDMAQMMPLFMMSQMSAQQQATNPSSMPAQMPFDPQMISNFEAMMNMTRQWQAFLAWQQQNANNPSDPSRPYNPTNYQPPSYSPTNHYGQGQVQHERQHHEYQHNERQHHEHQQQHQNPSRQSPPSRDPRLNDHNYSRKRHYEDDPRRR